MRLLGVLIIIGGILLGLYLGLWLCLVGGIIQAIHGFQANPIDAFKVAVGIVRIIVTGIVTWGTIFFCIFIGSVFFAAGQSK